MFFRKKTPTPLIPPPPGQLQLAVKAVVRKCARLAARELSRREARLSNNQKKLAITAFCLITGMLCFTTLYHGLYVHPHPARSFLATPATSTPVLPRLPDSPARRAPGIHSKATTGPIAPDSLTK